MSDEVFGEIAQEDVDLPIADDDYDFDDEEEDEDDAAGSSFMQNRELSWLTFNERVLDQGADESVPLLDRLNFISIFWSNLQEFFMVRVGSLTDLSFIDPPIIDSKTGMTPKEQIQAIHERCHELYPIQESYYEHVRGSLAKQGVRHLRPEDLSDEQRNYLFGLVRHNIEPFLSPQIINARHPFPHIENGKLYILVRLDDEAAAAERKKKKKDKEKSKKKDKGAEGVVLGLIPLPHQCERVIKLPGRGFQFILLEHAIEMFVPEIFSMYKIKHTNVICVTRNADIDANQGFDEQDEDYREHMKRLLKQRARLAPVRLECERPLSPVMEKLMLKKLGLKRYQVYDTVVPLDLGFTWGLGSKLSESKRDKLSAAPFTPAWPTSFDRKRRIIDQVSERETLLFYPYESMDPFVQLLREASTDPSVVSIKITLYRLASQSHLAEALIAAADAGKEVTALFELRARFDENNNIEWSQRFEEAGCNVIYGFRDYKVHSKICCITRQTESGLQHITQLGTGNYNEKTARLYTDLSFITTNEAFGRDAVEFFRNMQLENVSDNYEVLRVAPLQIKPMIIENLDKQMALARAGKPAVAFLKANSVTDKDVIEKISEASNAGVKITLFVRGICCIVPGVKGATENVRVVSIVGRLLEHSRIYCFGEGDDSTVYLSSADLMTRNLNKRVEIAWPVLDVELRRRILTYIDICMHDTAKLRELRRNATYTPLGAFCDVDEDGNSLAAFDSQNALIEQAAEAAEAALDAVEDAAGPNPVAYDDPAPAADEPPAPDAYDEPAFAAYDEPAHDASAEPAPGAYDEPAFAPLVEPAPEPALEAIAAAPEPELPFASFVAAEPEPAIGGFSELAAEPDGLSFTEFTPEPMAEPLSELAPQPMGMDVTFAEIAPEPIAEPAPPVEEAHSQEAEFGSSFAGDMAFELPVSEAGVEPGQNLEAPLSLDYASLLEPQQSAGPQAEVEPFAVQVEAPTAAGDAEAPEPKAAPIASERVAELINQLGSTPEQVAMTPRDPLTEMRIDDIIPTADEQPQAYAPEQAPRASASERPESAYSPEPPASAYQASQQELDSMESFFSQKSREIEMPSEHKGFFNR